MEQLSSALRKKGKLVKIVNLTYRSLEDAKKGMDFWVNKSE